MLLNTWSTQKTALPTLPWHSPRTTLPFLVCAMGSGGWRTTWRSSCLPHGDALAVRGSLLALFPCRSACERRDCHATLWQKCCLYSEVPCDLWCYKSWKTPSLLFLYNWKPNNRLQCQLEKQAAPLEIHIHVCAHAASYHQPGSAAWLVLIEGLK